MKKIIFLLLFPITLFSQTLTFNPGKALDVNDKIKIEFQIDSLTLSTSLSDTISKMYIPSFKLETSMSKLS